MLYIYNISVIIIHHCYIYTKSGYMYIFIQHQCNNQAYNNQWCPEQCTSHHGIKPPTLLIYSNISIIIIENQCHNYTTLVL